MQQVHFQIYGQYIYLIKEDHMTRISRNYTMDADYNRDVLSWRKAQYDIWFYRILLTLENV